jgi:glycosyltransferase involved in cell wall biosynthesis
MLIKNSLKENNIVFVITESFTFRFYLEKWIFNLADFSNIYIVGNFTNNEITSLEKQFSEYSIKFHSICIKRKIDIKSDLNSIFLLRKFILNIENPVIFSIMPKANFIISLIKIFSCNIKVASIITGPFWLNFSKINLKYYFFRIIESFIFYQSNMVIFDSLSQKNFALKHLLFSSQSIKFFNTVSLGGVDLSNYFKSERIRLSFRDSMGINSSRRVVGHFSRLCERKGTLDFLKVAQHIINTLEDPPIFYISGPAEERHVTDAIYEFSRKNSSHVIFKEGFFYNINEILNGIDILIMPSRWEGFGIVAAISSATGTPVLGFDVVGLRDAIKSDITGYLVPPHDINELACLTIKLLEDDLLYTKLSDTAQSYARENFSTNIFLSDFKDLYSRLHDGNF